MEEANYTVPGVNSSEDENANGFFRNLVASGPVPVLVVRAGDYKVVYCNRQFEEVIGYSCEKMQQEALSVYNLLGEAQYAKFNNQVHTVTANPAARTKFVSYNIKTGNDASRLCYIYAAPLENTGNAEYFHLVIMPELSERPMPFMSFDSRELFLHQFDKIGFGTFEWIIETDDVLWSDGIYDIYEENREKKDLKRSDIRKYIHPEDKDRAGDFVERALATGEGYDFEMKIITGRQKIKIVCATGSVIFDARRKPVKLIGSVRDITSQRTIELELKKNVEELNRSNKELEEFAYVASHDLQEPLRKITTFCDRLNDKYQDELSGDGIMYMERIMASAENMRTLIDNLLEFSRVSRANVDVAEVNLNFVMHEVKNALELVINDTAAMINYSGLPVIEASLTQLKQLFTNIIGNALKFRKAETAPIVDITTSILSEEDVLRYDLAPGVKYYRIDIADNGIGFENEYATRIFQIFQRLNGKAEYKGSGIGLAICKKIAERHNGLIFAKGDVDKGAIFTIVLPEKQAKQI